MTTFCKYELRCGCCGAESDHVQLTSTNVLGPGDLDGRPGEMMRSTLALWVRSCPACGYCSEELEECGPMAKQVVASADYQSLLKDESIPELARMFECCAMIARSEDRTWDAALDYRNAAWACDDAEADDHARRYRAAAVEWFRRAQERSPLEADPGTFEGVVADMLRRAGRFDEAMEVCTSGLSREAVPAHIREVLTMQRKLIEQRDTALHQVPERSGP